MVFNDFFIDMELIEICIFFLITGLVIACSAVFFYVFKLSQTSRLRNALIITFLFGLVFFWVFGLPIYLYFCHSEKSTNFNLNYNIYFYLYVIITWILF